MAKRKVKPQQFIAKPKAVAIDVGEAVASIAASKFKDANPTLDWESATPAVKQPFMEAAATVFEKIWHRKPN